uniref:Putative rab subfamily protein of small gtpase n=1 Tax=Tabanus bromius TaxID=304241 RepID=A0A0K8TSD2_TABBR
MKAIEAKVVVLGSQGVGKTSLVTRYVTNVLAKEIGPTIGASFSTCRLFLDDVKVKLLLWDTAGQERYKAMAPMYYRNSNAAILVFDVAQYSTFDDLKMWIQELQRNVTDPIVLILVGNKLDLEENRAVPRDEAYQFALKIGAKYFETSAMQEQGIEQVFLATAVGLINLSKEKKCITLRRYESDDSVTAYTSAGLVNGYAYHLPSVHDGIPVENHIKANDVGHLERGPWSIDNIAHGDAETSWWCCY